MMRAVTKICLLATFIVGMSVIWQGESRAATVSFEPLGQLADNLVSASRVDVDEDGSVYVVSRRRGVVVKFDRFGSKVGSFNLPAASGTGLAVTPGGKRLYVAEKDRVAIVDTATGAVSYLVSETFRFTRVADIDLDDQGFVYVADGGACNVRIFNAAGTQVGIFGTKGAGAGQFEDISGILVDSVRQRIYVSDPVYVNVSTPEVQVFDLGGVHIQTFPGPSGFGVAKMNYFSGMSVDHLGRLYVFDSARSDVYVYEVGADGAALVEAGSYTATGFAPGQLASPLDSAFDPTTKRLFVACGDGRVEYFGIDGGFNPTANSPPSVPLAVSPAGDSVVTVATPQFEFENASDINAGDTLSYSVAVYQGAAPVAALDNIPGDAAGMTAVPLVASYVEDAQHSWSVRAFDGSDYSAWSEPQYFYYNQLNSAPSVPQLISPLTIETTLSGSGKLSWQASLDSDPADSVSYLVELSTDPAFAVPVTQNIDAEEITLAQLDDYSDLMLGAQYYWRVSAIDTAGVIATSDVASFIYDTSVLRIASNMPATQIYLGGDHAYAGTLIGEAPLELRDFAPGVTTVVAERGGFETFAAPVTMGMYGKVTVDVALVPAITPEDFKRQDLRAAGQKLALLGAAAPAISDLDNDGVFDLLVMGGDGTATVYAGALDAEGALEFQVGVSQALPGPMSGAAPFVVDWNDDGLKDLLVGGDGILSLYLADGPASWGAPLSLQEVVNQLPESAALVPVVFDDGGDGVKDLLIGTADGNIYKFVNTQGDVSLMEMDAGGLLRSPFSGGVAPLLVDWNADGQRDLLAAAQGAVYLCDAQSDGTFVPVQMLTVSNLSARKTGGKGKSASSKSSLDLGENSRVVAVDVDGKGGKDLLVGNGVGELILVASHGQQQTPAFRAALLEKLAQIELAAAPDEVLLAALQDVEASLVAGKDAQAAARVEALLGSFALSDDVNGLLLDLAGLLK